MSSDYSRIFIFFWSYLLKLQVFSESTYKNKSLLETPLHCNYPRIKHEIKRNKD